MNKITRNIKDISQKAIMALFNGEEMPLFGLKLARAVKLLNIEVPIIRMQSCDLIFLLEDGSVLHLEFQTDLKLIYLSRFLTYEGLIHEKYGQREITTIVIFAAGVKRQDFFIASDTLHYKPHTVFLDEEDGDAIIEQLEAKVANKISLNSEEINKLFFTSLMKSGIINVEEKVTRQLDIANTIEDERVRETTMLTIYGVMSKFLNPKELENLSEVFFKMDPLVKHIEKEIAKAEKKAEKRLAKEVANAKMLSKLETARKLLKTGLGLDLIANATELSLETVKGLQS